MANAGVAAVRAEDFRLLKAQVDQMKERLDFICPMLPLVNFVQDYFQKVECEASVQLMRLKNAQVLRPVGSDDDINNAQLETVKWLHCLTEVVLMLHNHSGAGTSVPSAPSHASCDGLVESARSERSNARSCISLPVQPRRLDLPQVDPPPMGQGMKGRRLSGSAMSSPMNATSSNARAIEAFRAGDFLLHPPDTSVPDRTPCRTVPGSSAPSNMQYGAATALSSVMRTGALLHGGEDSSLSESQADPGTGGAHGVQGEGPHGLVLGKGSWATSYRQAQGQRREALKLLCQCNIVTERELGDDNTVISEEHIDECVSLASEMLQTWPISMWEGQPQEAKKFFEARLTVLYQKKFGEQKAAS